MRFLRAAALLFATVLAVNAGARAQPGDAAAAALTRMFTATAIDPSAFAPSFTASVPLTAIQSIVDDTRARLGALSSVRKAGSDYALTFARGGLLATVGLDAGSKITSLLFHDETSAADRRALERLLASKAPQADWFAPSFLAQLPLGQVTAILNQLTAQGAFVRLDERDGAYFAIFEKAEQHVLVSTDADGRITFLFLRPATARAATFAEALERLKPPTGEVAYVIVKGRSDVAALSADRPMAVGSAFKLAVLAALRADIDAKRRAWSDVVPLPERAKSLPTGDLRNWPSGTPITLATYAAQMISASDNTAADVLAGVVGRAALERISPRNTPFLTTRELFTLKAKDATLRDAYGRADTAGRRALLPRIDANGAPRLEALDFSPALLDVEWYMTSRELCALMLRVQDLDLMTINPGVSAGDWKRIAYKGGSDAGVLNLTSFLTSPSGVTYCVSVTWNDRTHPIDEPAEIRAYGAVLEQLSRG